MVKYLQENFDTSPAALRTAGISQGTSPAQALALGLSPEEMLMTGLAWAKLVYTDAGKKKRPIPGQLLMSAREWIEVSCD